MSLGALIRDVRLSRGWSQGQLAERLCDAPGYQFVTREEVSRWERDKVIPGPRWRKVLSTVLDIPPETLDEEARISRVNRRQFMNLAALTATYGKLASEMVGSVAARDPGPLTTVQTKYGTDLVIASLVDRPSVNQLRRWMRDGSNPVLRVNATGILAKVPDQDFAPQVTETLVHDEDVRHLYTAAVIARTGALSWATATRIAHAPTSISRQQAAFLASRLSKEVLNPRDAGARWCSATVLREISPLLGQTGASRDARV